MLRNFSFIVDDLLAGSALPGTRSPLMEDLAEASAAGITTVISLTEHPLHAATVQEAGLQYLHLPVPDYHAPKMEQIRTFVRKVEESRDKGGAVLVHCFAGHGRTGTMLAAWLIHEGMETDEAIETVRDKRPGSIESPAQIAVLRRYEKLVRPRSP